MNNNEEQRRAAEYRKIQADRAREDSNFMFAQKQAAVSAIDQHNQNIASEAAYKNQKQAIYNIPKDTWHIYWQESALREDAERKALAPIINYLDEVLRYAPRIEQNNSGGNRLWYVMGNP